MLVIRRKENGYDREKEAAEVAAIVFDLQE